MNDYSEFKHILFERREPNILWMTLNRPHVLNAADRQLHTELTEVWKLIHKDPSVQVAVITGAGRAFSAGGDLQMVEDAYQNFDEILRILNEARDLVNEPPLTLTPREFARRARKLTGKGVKVNLDLWGQDVKHDWPWWNWMLNHYLPIHCR